MNTMQTIWTKEEGSTGQDIIIRRDKIEWARYDIPGTSHSAGSATYYQHTDLVLYSPLYHQIAEAFGESVAQQALYAVQNISNHQPFIDEKMHEDSIQNYFSAVPENANLPTPWLKELKPVAAVKSDFSSLRSIGLVSMETTRFNHDCFNLLTNDHLFKLEFTNTVSFSALKNPRGFILSTPRQIIIGHRSDSGVKIINPLQKLPNLFSHGRKELGDLYLFDDHYLILFSLDHASKSAGELILQGDFNGNFIGKKTLAHIKFIR